MTCRQGNACRDRPDARTNGGDFGNKPELANEWRNGAEAMSRKTELEADLKRVGYQLGGSHLTRQARGATFGTFASTMRQLGYGIHCASQIGGKHLQAFV